MSPADSPFASVPAPGPHPATAELRAYAAGTLTPTDEYRIETHLLDCERCADLVEGFAMSDAATTDQAVAGLRTRLQARLGAEEPAPVAAGWAWPRLAAAAALLAAVAGGVWTLEQHEVTPAPATARLETAAPAAPATAAATAPAAEAEVAPAASAAAEVAAESKAAPEFPKPADYVAVTPSHMKRRAAPRTISRSSSAPDDIADRSELADMAAAPSVARNGLVAKAPAVALDAPAASAPAAPDTKGYSSAGAATARKSESALAGRVAPDSAAALSEVVVASTMKKAKAASTAVAIVANTPMPTAPALSPAPVGGSLALREYLRREASQFDPEINNLRLSGTVRIRFVVEADGKLSHLKVTRGLRKDYDDEALRLVCEGPAWQPGIASGKRTPLPMEVIVPF